jgi:hypothetical protein
VELVLLEVVRNEYFFYDEGVRSDDSGQQFPTDGTIDGLSDADASAG